MSSSLQLLASSFEDGWAIVREQTSIILVRPPFLRADVRHITEADVSRAIKRYGFVSHDDKFQDWSELVEELSRRYADAVNARREALGLLVDVRIDKVPEAVVVELLERIPRELIDVGETALANKLLVEILRNEHVMQRNDLLHRCRELLAICAERLARRAQPGNVRSEARRIAERGCLWAMGS
jgi:hypothetical protein